MWVVVEFGHVWVVGAVWWCGFLVQYCWCGLLVLLSVQWVSWFVVVSCQCCLFLWIHCCGVIGVVAVCF